VSSLGIAHRTDLKGKRYVNMLRCSTVQQADASPESQKDFNDHYAATQGLLWAGEDMYSEGVSGSQTFNRQDIEDIITRKKEKNDFDIVVVYEYGRMTRGGVEHGHSVEKELRKAGVEIISSTEHIPKGPIGELIKSVKHYANQQQAMNLSAAIVRQMCHAREQGKRSASGRTPYGVDRLYVGPNNEKRMLIRWENLAQVRYHPETMEEIGRSYREPRRPSRTKGQRKQRRQPFYGYKKQRDERPILVPGDPVAVEIVRRIFRMYLIDDIGMFKITQILREENAPAPGNQIWHITTVRCILLNPLYVGQEIVGRWSRAIYTKAGPDGPVPVSINQDQLGLDERLVIPTIQNPRTEWTFQPNEHMRNFLPDDLREKAVELFERIYHPDERAAMEARRGRQKPKCEDSAHVLHRIVSSMQTGFLLSGVGRHVPRKNGKILERAYLDTMSRARGIAGDFIRNLPAPQFEDAIVPAVLEALMDQPWIEERILAALVSMETDRPSIADRRKRLEQEREEITHRLKGIYRNSHNLSDDDLDALVKDDNSRLGKVKLELADLEHENLHLPPTPEQAVAAVRERLRSLPSNWRSLPNRNIKRLLRVVIERCVVDMRTFETEVTVRLPFEVMQPVKTASDGQNLTDCFTKHWLTEAIRADKNTVKIAEIHCIRDDKPTRYVKCWTCSRREKAATTVAA
ncbi:MAG TPA: recombinase family protein, partial [Tepidisphaeraceae bacterium]